MSARIPTIAVLFLIWLILAASYDVVHLVLGVAAAVGVVWLNPVAPASPFRNVSLWGFAGYAPWLFVRILKSSIHLTRLILDPALPIAPKLIRHQTDLESDGEVVILGNSITLTPGTITVEVSSDELVVHAIDDASSRDLTEGTLERKIGQMFRRRKAAP
jgi:multicomponent Na+:H+ antiporter subunit E